MIKALYTEKKAKTMLIDKNESCLLIIDVQERLVPVMAEPRKVIDGCARLIRGAGLLNIPVIVTEQYPKGLGETIFDVREAASKDSFFAKTSFSAVSEPGFLDRLNALSKKQVVLAGVEAHVCVFQTGVELMENGFDVFFVADASSSRTAENEKTARRRFSAEGIPVVSIEMVLFEWLRKSGTPEFKEIQKHLIR